MAESYRLIGLCLLNDEAKTNCTYGAPSTHRYKDSAIADSADSKANTGPQVSVCHCLLYELTECGYKVAADLNKRQKRSHQLKSVETDWHNLDQRPCLCRASIAVERRAALCAAGHDECRVEISLISALQYPQKHALYVYGRLHAPSTWPSGQLFMRMVILCPRKRVPCSGEVPRVPTIPGPRTH